MERHALWLHDFGSQIGLRYAIAHPERIVALVISNGDIYRDTLGPGYEILRRYWEDPSLENLAAIKPRSAMTAFAKKSSTISVQSWRSGSHRTCGSCIGT